MLGCGDRVDGVTMATGDYTLYFKLCNTLHVLMCYTGIVRGNVHSFVINYLVLGVAWFVVL